MKSPLLALEDLLKSLMLNIVFRFLMSRCRQNKGVSSEWKACREAIGVRVGFPVWGQVSSLHPQVPNSSPRSALKCLDWNAKMNAMMGGDPSTFRPAIRTEVLRRPSEGELETERLQLSDRCQGRVPCLAPSLDCIPKFRRRHRKFRCKGT